jgi:hypothetical protein
MLIQIGGELLLEFGLKDSAFGLKDSEFVHTLLPPMSHSLKAIASVQLAG